MFGFFIEFPLAERIGWTTRSWQLVGESFLMVVPADVFPGKVDRRLADFFEDQRQIGRRGATPSGGLPSPNQCFLEYVFCIAFIPRLLPGKQQQLGSVIGEPLVPFLLPGIVSHGVFSTSVSYSVARSIFCLTNFALAIVLSGQAKHCGVVDMCINKISALSLCPKEN
jgi:hypothetical protein